MFMTDTFTLAKYISITITTITIAAAITTTISTLLHYYISFNLFLAPSNPYYVI